MLSHAVMKHEIITGNHIEANMPSSIHIAFGVDANFIHAMGVTITSLLIHNKDEHFVFHIFVNSMNPSDRTRLDELAKEYDTVIHFYWIDPQVFKQLPMTLQYTAAIYNRFIISQCLYGMVDKVLYLDADIVCIGKIRELIDTDLSDHIAAVVDDIDEGHLKRRVDRLKLKQGRYFNSGVMYINIDKWNERDVSNKAIQLLVENYDSFKLPDQDALNVLLEGQVKFINQKWNRIYDLEHMCAGSVLPDTVLIHYAGRQKPWHSWCKHHQGTSYFINCKAISRWADIPFSKPQHYKEMRMLGKSLFIQKKFMSSLFWYYKYSQEKIRFKVQH